jgi:hypothetical protein
MESFIEEASGDENLDPSFIVLSKEEKMRLIAGEFEIIDELCTQLETMEKHLPFIDSKHFKNLQTARTEELPQLKLIHENLETNTVILSNRVQELLNTYNRTVMLLILC